MSTATRDIVVQNALGLHARPAMQFVDAANQFASNIKVSKGGSEPVEADGKSVMQMIILAAEQWRRWPSCLTRSLGKSDRRLRVAGCELRVKARNV